MFILDLKFKVFKAKIDLELLLKILKIQNLFITILLFPSQFYQIKI